MDSFGDLIRKKREHKKMFLRQLAAKLDIDTALLSKIERGERKAKREHVLQLAKIFSIDYKYLHTLWLADKVYEVIQDEELGLNALKVAEQQANYKKQNHS